MSLTRGTVWTGPEAWAGTSRDSQTGSRYVAAMVALRRHAPARMTLDEFLAWDPHDPSGRTWQLVDGEPLAMAPGSDAHGSIQAELARLIGNFLLEQHSHCRVITEAGIVPRVRANRNYRVPDLAVTCSPPSQAVMVPEPVLLIELLSPGNDQETWTNVWAYTSIPSVMEILAVYTTRIEAELLRRDAQGNWPEQPETVSRDGVLTLRSIGFAAALAAVYRTTGLSVS